MWATWQLICSCFGLFLEATAWTRKRSASVYGISLSGCLPQAAALTRPDVVVLQAKTYDNLYVLSFDSQRLEINLALKT